MQKFNGDRRHLGGTTMRHAATAFENAIAAGILSNDRFRPNFAGRYMYMHSDMGADHFKHCDTRQYVTARYEVAS